MFIFRYHSKITFAFKNLQSTVFLDCLPDILKWLSPQILILHFLKNSELRSFQFVLTSNHLNNINVDIYNLYIQSVSISISHSLSYHVQKLSTSLQDFVCKLCCCHMVSHPVKTGERGHLRLINLHNVLGQLRFHQSRQKAHKALAYQRKGV